LVRLPPSNQVICLLAPQQRAEVALTDLLIEYDTIRYAILTCARKPT